MSSLNSNFDPKFIDEPDLIRALDTYDHLTKHGDYFLRTSSVKNVEIAIKILNKIAREGSDYQTKYLNDKSKIISLNHLLSDPKWIVDKLHCTEEEAQTLKGLSIALPQTKREKMIETATRIPRAAFALLTDALLLPFAGILLLVALCSRRSGINFDINSVKAAGEAGKPHIMLLHGSGFNDSEWVLVKAAIGQKKYGSNSSLNFDGLVSNLAYMGIEDYAHKLRNEITQIKRLTGQTEFVFVGHSMGGLIGAYYAENFARDDGVSVKHVISLGTPWRGSPLLNRMGHKPDIENQEITSETYAVTPKRYQQMCEGSAFRSQLIKQAMGSEWMGDRAYYHVASSTDYASPAPSSYISHDPRRQLEVSYLGHYGLVVSPRVLYQLCTWLGNIAKEKRSI